MKLLRAASAVLVLLVCSCEDSMRDQARIKPLGESAFYADGRAARPLPPGTVARGQLSGSVAFRTGRDGNEFVKRSPAPITADFVRLGQERFNIFCAACHGADGHGRGIVVQRGFAPPPSYHIDRLRDAPDGYLFDVITHGKGAMYPFASRVPVEQRWAIVAYLRSLQLSQNAAPGDVPAEQLNKLQEQP